MYSELALEKPSNECGTVVASRTVGSLATMVALVSLCRFSFVRR